MKILYIDPIMIPDYLGGSHKSLLSIISAMQEEGHEAILGTPGTGLLLSEAENSSVKTTRFFLPKLIRTRITIGKIRIFNIVAALYDLSALFIASFSLLHTITKTKPDIIHANQISISIACGFAGAISGVPCVWHIRENPSAHVPGVALKLYGLFAYLFADKIIVNSQYTADLFKETLACQKIIVLPIGIEHINKLTEHKEKEAELTAEKVIAVFGRVVPIKGHHVLIKAMEQINQTSLKCKLLIYGNYQPDDPYYQSLIALVNKYGLINTIEFCGFLSNIDEAISSPSLVVSPSVEPESFGRTIIEAMSAGKPVIATRLGAHPEIIIDNVTGILVDPDDPDELAQAMISLLSNDELLITMGQNGQQRYLDHFTLDHYYENLNKIYDEVLHPRAFSV